MKFILLSKLISCHILKISADAFAYSDIYYLWCFLTHKTCFATILVSIGIWESEIRENSGKFCDSCCRQWGPYICKITKRPPPKKKQKTSTNEHQQKCSFFNISHVLALPRNQKKKEKSTENITIYSGHIFKLWVQPTWEKMNNCPH